MIIHHSKLLEIFAFPFSYISVCVLLFICTDIIVIINEIECHAPESTHLFDC